MSGTWFRNGDWDDAAKRRFDKKLRALPESRWSEILRIKAVYLLDEPCAVAGRAEWALDLCHESIRHSELRGYGHTSAQGTAIEALLRLERVPEARAAIFHFLEYTTRVTSEQTSGPMLAIWMMFEHDIEPFPLDALEFTLTRATLLTANPRFWRQIGLGYVAEQRGELPTAADHVREALTCVHTWRNGKPDWGYGEVSELHRTPDRAMAWIRRFVPDAGAEPQLRRQMGDEGA